MNPTDPHAAILLAKPKKPKTQWLRCMSCYRGKTPYGTGCKTCGGTGRVSHEVKP